MRNGVRVNSHLPDLFKRPGIILGADGVIQEKFRFPLGGVFFKRQSYYRSQENPFGAAFGNNPGTLFEPVFPTESGRNNDRSPLPDFGCFFSMVNPLRDSQYLNIRYSEKFQI